MVECYKTKPNQTKPNLSLSSLLFLLLLLYYYYPFPYSLLLLTFSLEKYITLSSLSEGQVTLYLDSCVAVGLTRTMFNTNPTKLEFCCL